MFNYMKAMREDMERRQGACMAEVNKSLEKYNCGLRSQCGYSQDGRHISQVAVVGLMEKEKVDSGSGEQGQAESDGGQG